jgi:hypothetical protein
MRNDAFRGFEMARLPMGNIDRREKSLKSADWLTKE